MTGIETAGLVLGGFPIVVDAMGQMISLIKHRRSSRYTMMDFLRGLQSELAMCRNTVEGLLTDVVPPEVWDQLMAGRLDHNDSMAIGEQYEPGLRECLDKDYDAYMDHMMHLLEALESLRSALQISPETGEVPWQEESSFRRLWSRAKFTVLKTEFRKALRQIQIANYRLKIRLDQSKELEPLRNERRMRENRFARIRHNARSLYGTLVSTRAWRCGCRGHHVVHLCLEPRFGEKPTSSYAAKETPLKFRVLLGLATELRLSGFRSMAQYRDILAVPAETLSVAAGDIDLQTESMKSMAIDPTQKDKDRPEGNGLKQVDNICSALWTGKPGDGFLLEDATDPRLYPTTWPRDRHSKIHGSGALPITRHWKVHLTERMILPPERRRVNLRNVLDMSQWDYEERIRIAMTLASSTLQLQNTPWLGNKWSSSNIAVISSDLESDVPLEGLFLSHVIRSGDLTGTIPGEISDQNQRPRKPQENLLFSLGITIAELSLGRNIPQLAETGHANDTLVTDPTYSTQQLEDEVYRERGTVCGDVVRRCLNDTIDVRVKSFENEEFGWAVFDKVVKPLNLDYENFMKSWL